jgi:hypothetical protein
MKKIRQRVVKLREESVTRLAKELQDTPDSRRRFEVARILKRKFMQPLQLKDSDGFMTSSPVRLLEMATPHFNTYFNPPGIASVDPWGNYGKTALEEPIEPKEVEGAMSKLRNGRSVGPDGIPGELLKCSGEAGAKQLADLYNSVHEKKEYLEALGEKGL